MGKQVVQRLMWVVGIFEHPEFDKVVFYIIIPLLDFRSFLHLLFMSLLSAFQSWDFVWCFIMIVGGTV